MANWKFKKNWRLGAFAFYVATWTLGVGVLDTWRMCHSKGSALIDVNTGPRKSIFAFLP
jgi:hypothetical protein